MSWNIPRGCERGFDNILELKLIEIQITDTLYWLQTYIWTWWEWERERDKSLIKVSQCERNTGGYVVVCTQLFKQYIRRKILYIYVWVMTIYKKEDYDGCGDIYMFFHDNVSAVRR
jgi:hypothetical protein